MTLTAVGLSRRVCGRLLRGGATNTLARATAVVVWEVEVALRAAAGWKSALAATGPAHNLRSTAVGPVTIVGMWRQRRTPPEAVSVSRATRSDGSGVKTGTPSMQMALPPSLPQKPVDAT